MNEILFMINKVCCIVVTYKPAKKDLIGIELNSKLVDKLVIVNNGKPENRIEDLQKNNKNIDIINNNSNLGIDVATNIGIKRYYKSYDWILTLDQDSLIEDSMIKNMLQAYNNLNMNLKDRVRMLTPIINNYGIKSEYNKLKKYEIKELVIASGRLILTKAFDEVGFNDEIFFIDGVEWDFSFKLMKSSYVTIQVNNAILQHQMGNNKTMNYFGKTIYTSNYPPLRIYYITRNNLKIIKTYFHLSPKICISILRNDFKNIIKIILLEDKKILKLNYFLLGLFHFSIGKYGKL